MIDDHPSKIISDGRTVYFVTGGTIASRNERTNNIKQVSLADGAVSVLATGGEVTDFYKNPNQQPSLGLQQDADSFYFCQMNTRGHSALMKLNKKSGELTQIAPSINHTMEFVVDETSVYYFDEVPGTGSFGPVALRKVSKQGGEPSTLDQGNAGWIRYLAVDAKQIYFTDIAKVYALAK